MGISSMRLGSILPAGRLAGGGPGFGDRGEPVDIEVPNGQLDGGPSLLKQG